MILVAPVHDLIEFLISHPCLRRCRWLDSGMRSAKPVWLHYMLHAFSRLSIGAKTGFQNFCRLLKLMELDPPLPYFGRIEALFGLTI
ncbi:hypothetical protein CUMW_189100 [Citrus unshiu]|nr:hypothetical protein CUMW_189100 [Citrus unshiu]